MDNKIDPREQNSDFFDTCGGDLKEAFSSSDNLTYDEAARNLLSNKAIVANILHEVVPEYSSHANKNYASNWHFGS